VLLQQGINSSVVSSLQLVFLEQIQLEDPIFYYKRAAKIMNDLKGRGPQQEQDIVTPIVITHYIRGITNNNVYGTNHKKQKEKTILTHV